VRELGLTRVCPAADLAFLMSVDDDVRTRMVTRLSLTAPGPYLAVAPSQVVATYCRKAGIDYVGSMARFIEDARDQTGHTVVVLAHSAEAGAGVSHMNDLPLCRGIHERVASTEGIVFFDEDLLPGELRALIGAAAVLVTSRFHGMISALTERVPVLVIGWSHKYAEVLEQFGLAEFALPYSALGESPDLMNLLRATLAARDEIAREIAQRLPEAAASAGENVRILREAVSAPALVS
jgi:polysaccharide pyruvyl transferase WcaK-like protein